jgi:hypothetical protein
MAGTPSKKGGGAVEPGHARQPSFRVANEPGSASKPAATSAPPAAPPAVAAAARAAPAPVLISPKSSRRLVAEPGNVHGPHRGDEASAAPPSPSLHVSATVLRAVVRMQALVRAREARKVRRGGLGGFLWGLGVCAAAADG